MVMGEALSKLAAPLSTQADEKVTVLAVVSNTPVRESTMFTVIIVEPPADRLVEAISSAPSTKSPGTVYGRPSPVPREMVEGIVLPELGLAQVGLI